MTTALYALFLKVTILQLVCDMGKYYLFDRQSFQWWQWYK